LVICEGAAGGVVEPAFEFFGGDEAAAAAADDAEFGEEVLVEEVAADAENGGGFVGGEGEAGERPPLNAICV
jgi:hypothetical protein